MKSIPVRETCQRWEAQKTSTIKCDCCREQGSDLWLYLTKYITGPMAQRICCVCLLLSSGFKIWNKQSQTQGQHCFMQNLGTNERK